MDFCQKANPMGDMRRVVVATEGARQHFGTDGVNAGELSWLFDIARWRRPADFVQTQRDAARSKFGWLERIPGRSGAVLWDSAGPLKNPQERLGGSASFPSG